MADDSGLEEVLGQAIKAAADVIRGLPDHTLLEMARASVGRGGAVVVPAAPRASAAAGREPKKEVAKSAPRPTARPEGVSIQMIPAGTSEGSRKILALLAKHGPMTSHDIAAKLGRPSAQGTAGGLGKMATAGLVLRQPDQTWRLP